MNIVYKSDVGFIVEIHSLLLEDDSSLGIVGIGACAVPFRHIHLGEESVTITIPFKDLTVYDDASYKELQEKRAQENDK